MLQLFQEMNLPKLSDTSLYQLYNQTSQIRQNTIDELKNTEHIVKPEDIQEVLSLIMLNGDPIARKAVKAYRNGDIVVIYNKATSKIPLSLPYITVKRPDKTIAYIFADKAVDNLTSAYDYPQFMAVLEAAYLALRLATDPSTFLMNSQLMLSLCKCYSMMTVKPLKALKMDGENLTKAYIYVIAHFYKMFKGTEFSAETLPYKRIISDKIDPAVVSQIIDEVKSSPDNSINGLMELIKNVNPIRYERLNMDYVPKFQKACGIPLTFALENIAYLFLMISGVRYKSKLISYELIVMSKDVCREAITRLISAIE